MDLVWNLNWSFSFGIPNGAKKKAKTKLWNAQALLLYSDLQCKIFNPLIHSGQACRFKSWDAWNHLEAPTLFIRTWISEKYTVSPHLRWTAAKTHFLTEWKSFPLFFVLLWFPLGISQDNFIACQIKTNNKKPFSKSASLRLIASLYSPCSS